MKLLKIMYDCSCIVLLAENIDKAVDQLREIDENFYLSGDKIMHSWGDGYSDEECHVVEIDTNKAQFVSAEYH